MIDSPGVFANRLNQLDPLDGPLFFENLVELVSQASAETFEVAYPAIFRFFEAYPDIQMLGPFLNILDDICPSYLEEPIQSVESMPSTSTLLMLNRHLNDDLNDSIRNRLITCLRGANDHSTSSPIVRKEAAQYLKRQEHLDWQHLMLPIADRTASDSALVPDSVRAIDGRYVILRGCIAPTSVMQVRHNRFGLVVENQSAKSWKSLSMHLMVAVELPMHLRVFFHTNPIVVEGILSIDVQRISDGTVKTVYKISAERVARPVN